MPPEQQPNNDDRFLTQYLLGALPAEEAESMDILCVSDEALATRLTAIENDLVDAHVRGELAGDDLERFKSFYLASQPRRAKVEFAAALLEREKKPAPAPVAKPIVAAPVPVATPVPKPVVPKPVVSKPVVSKQMDTPSPARPPKAPRSRFHWGFALATAAVVLVAGYLALDNVRLRRQVADAQSQHAGFDQREQQLQKQLDDQRSANAESAKEIEHLRQSQTNLDALKMVTLLLPPPTRGAARPPAMTLQPGTEVAVLLLTLEADEFPQYRAAIKDPSGDQTVWTSANLQSAAVGDKKMVSIGVPAGLLKQQNYVVELTGLPARGSPATIGSYPFHAVLK